MIASYVANRLANSNHPEVEANILARELNANPPLVKKIAEEKSPAAPAKAKQVLADQILEALERGALTANQIRTMFGAGDWETEKALTVLMAAGKIKKTSQHYHLVTGPQPSQGSPRAPEASEAPKKTRRILLQR